MNYRITGDFRAPFRIFPIVEETSSHKVELLLKVRASDSPRDDVWRGSLCGCPSAHPCCLGPTRAVADSQIRADIPENNYGANVTIRFPVPRNAATVHPELSAASAVTSGPRAAVGGAADPHGAAGTAGQAAEYRAKDRQVRWRLALAVNRLRLRSPVVSVCHRCGGEQVIWQIKKFVGGTEHTLRTRITLSAPSTSSVRKEMGPIGCVRAHCGGACTNHSAHLCRPCALRRTA